MSGTSLLNPGWLLHDCFLALHVKIIRGEKLFCPPPPPPRIDLLLFYAWLLPCLLHTLSLFGGKVLCTENLRLGEQKGFSIKLLEFCSNQFTFETKSGNLMAATPVSSWLPAIQWICSMQWFSFFWSLSFLSFVSLLPSCLKYSVCTHTFLQSLSSHCLSHFSSSSKMSTPAKNIPTGNAFPKIPSLTLSSLADWSTIFSIYHITMISIELAVMLGCPTSWTKLIKLHSLPIT